MKNNIYDITLNVLENYAPTRSDDFLLFGKVCQVMGLDINKSFRDVMSNHVKYSLPSFESVSRARRKVFELRPDLNPIAQERADEERQFRKWVINRVSNLVGEDLSEKIK